MNSVKIILVKRVIAQNIVDVRLLILWSMDIFLLTTKGRMLLCRLSPPEAGKVADKVPLPAEPPVSPARHRSRSGEAGRSGKSQL